MFGRTEVYRMKATSDEAMLTSRSRTQLRTRDGTVLPPTLTSRRCRQATVSVVDMSLAMDADQGGPSSSRHDGCLDTDRSVRHRSKRARSRRQRRRETHRTDSWEYMDTGDHTPRYRYLEPMSPDVTSPSTDYDPPTRPTQPVQRSNYQGRRTRLLNESEYNLSGPKWTSSRYFLTHTDRHRRRAARTKPRHHADKQLAESTTQTSTPLDPAADLQALEQTDTQETRRRPSSNSDDDMTWEQLDLPAAKLTRKASPTTGDDPDILTADSLTLPHIERVLRSEGVQPNSITQQIDALRRKIARDTSRYPQQPPPAAGPAGAAAVTQRPRPVRLADGLSRVNNIGLPTAPAPVPQILNPPATDEVANSTCSCARDLTHHLYHQHHHPPAPHSHGNGDVNSPSPGDPSDVTAPNNLLSLAIEREEKTLSSYRDDIAKTRWLTSQHVERLAMGSDFVPPRVVLLASNFPNLSTLQESVRQQSSILLIVYNFETDTFDAVVDRIKKSLNTYRDACLARSILFACKGGADHLFVFKKRVVTLPKLQKDDASDLVRFWKEVGELMSRVDADEAWVNILVPDMLTKQALDNKTRKNSELMMRELEKIVKPNIVHFGLIDRATPVGRQHLSTYIDCEVYQSKASRLTGDIDTDSPGHPHQLQQQSIQHLSITRLYDKTRSASAQTGDDVIDQVMECNQMTQSIASE